MILVNGKPYVGALDDPKEFAQFVLTIASDAYYSTPTPTASPSECDADTVRRDADAHSVERMPLPRLGRLLYLPTWRNW